MKNQFQKSLHLYFIIVLISLYLQPLYGKPNDIEHLRFGKPDSSELLIRNAYVLSYNKQYRIPNWVAYHVVPDYLNTPTRTGKFSSFRVDSEVENPVATSEYIGLFDSKGYARGHIAPFKIMGGDRDKDGIYVTYENPSESDRDDEITIFQGNYMSNIAPQHHAAINGPGGLWFKLERWIQDTLIVKHRKEVWVYAGNIIIDTMNLEGVGNNNNIIVPDMFYKILILKTEDNKPPYVLAFLFPHFKTKNDVKEGEIFRYLVPVNYIEAITGLDFFNVYSEEIQQSFEKNIDLSQWREFLN